MSRAVRGCCQSVPRIIWLEACLASTPGGVAYHELGVRQVLRDAAAGGLLPQLLGGVATPPLLLSYRCRQVLGLFCAAASVHVEACH